MIDDGSKDGSGKICDEYAAKDARIRVFHKKNGGVSSARNLGLDNAQGEWIAFVDSDDWIDQQYINTLLPLNDENMVVCSLYYESTIIEKYILSENFYSNKEHIRNNLDNLLIAFPITSPCSKILKRSYIARHNIHFETNINAGEDMLFIYKRFLHFTQTSTIHQIPQIAKQMINN